MSARVATGLDRLAGGDDDVVRLVRGRRVGLVAHPASVTAGLVHARDVLVGAGADVAALFGPEHGYGGEAQDMIGVGTARDPVTHAPIHSLYGAREEDLSPRPEQLAGLSAIVIDLQDVGARYYTFAWTAALVLRAAAAAGIETIVLDRPNPLGGEVIEGAPQRPGHRSFVGLHDVSVRHGMTIAELARLASVRDGIDASALTVVPMRGWQRAMQFEETGLPWVLPSPNMPTVDTARVYPGACVLEGVSTISEGRGTTRPFEIWGAPFIDGRALAARVQSDGVALRALTFRPTFHKHAGAVCGGVQVHVTDARRARSYPLYLRLLAAVRALYGEALVWRTETYEYVTDPIAIDLLTGGPEVRLAVDGMDPEAAIEAVLASAGTSEEEFRAGRTAHLLY